MGLKRSLTDRRKIWIESNGVRGYYKKMGWKPWTKKELKFIENNYENMTRRELAKALGRSYNAVKGVIDHGRAKAFKSDVAIRRQNARHNTGMFVKGQLPIN